MRNELGARRRDQDARIAAPALSDGVRSGFLALFRLELGGLVLAELEDAKCDVIDLHL